VRFEVGSARSRGEPTEASSRKLTDEAAELEREERLEERGGRHADVADEVVDVASIAVERVE
jgi:hypothetical protein